MPDKEKAREELRKLVEKYHRQKSEIANEEQVCQSLVLPLFNRVLDWDTENPSEFKSQYSQRGKRSDYVVFLNGISQFVIEAKALDREIKQNYHDYEQALNYLKSKERDFAILTNFKHMILLRNLDSPPLKCEVKILDIEKVVENDADFDILWNFQREVWTTEKGEILYKFKPGKGGAPVSKLLVEDMKKWRLALLTSLKKHPKLNDFADLEKELPYIEQEVQRFIDRLIFICYCEDNELKERELKNALEDKKTRYSGKDGFLVSEVKEVFKDYRSQYDSDLFFEQGYCDLFRFEDAVLAKIISDLRDHIKKSSYNFAEIESDVLGKAYENFIGHVITGTKRLKEKESVSKRKAEGIYYTPQYIVNYIVDNTLREYIKENKIGTFDGLLKIKVLDPACGSGTFLIRAFEVLEEEAKRILRVRELGYDNKVRLATSCIFGVDKDERAVDITKLRLSLTLAARQKLPELGRNIKCGDSLIDDPSIVQEKAFKWEEKFKDIMQNGGFDVVVGNPPYVRIHEFTQDYKEYYSNKFKSATGQYDIYVLFFERAIQLLRDKRYLGFITSNKFLIANYGIGVREYILKTCNFVKELDVSNMDVFKDASVYPCIILLQKENDAKKREENEVKVLQNIATESQLIFEKNFILVKQKEFSKRKEFTLDVSSNSQIYKLLGKIDKVGLELGNFCEISRGFRPPSKKLILPDEEHKKLGLREREEYDKLVIGKDLNKPYGLKWSGIWVKYEEDKIGESKPREVFANPKILIRDIGKKPKAYYDEESLLCLKTIYFIYLPKNDISLKYVTGLLNSTLILFYFTEKFSIMHIQGGYLRFRKQFLQKIPVKIVSQSNQQPIIKLVDGILSLHNRLNELGDKHTVGRERIEEEIKKTDAEIDELVYQLYGITEEEKKIIEESLA